MSDLHKLADELMELRRYVKTNPKHVGEKIHELAYSLPMLGLNDDLGTRLRINLTTGQYWLAVDPEVASNYLYNTAFELKAGKS